MIGSPRKRLPKSIVDLYETARFEIASQLGRLRRRGRRESHPEHRLLNLGCGPDSSGHYPGFLNADHFLFRGQVDCCLDLREPLPFPDEEWDGILLHHVLEHLPVRCVVPHLKECHRVLRPGGVLRVAVPDCGLAARLYAAAVVQGDVEAGKELCGMLPAHLGEFEIPMDAMNEFFHSDPTNTHHLGFDEQSLTRALTRAGFGEVARQGFETSLLPELAGVGREWWRRFTLYVDARRERASTIPD